MVKNAATLEQEAELADALRRQNQMLADYATRVQEVRELLAAIKASQEQISELMVRKRDPGPVEDECEGDNEQPD